MQRLKVCWRRHRLMLSPFCGVLKSFKAVYCEFKHAITVFFQQCFSQLVFCMEYRWKIHSLQ